MGSRAAFGKATGSTGRLAKAFASGGPRLNRRVRIGLGGPSLAASGSGGAGPSLAAAAQVLLEEVDRPLPGVAGVALVVGAEPVVVAEERVAGTLVEDELDLGPRVFPDLLLELLGIVDGDEVVRGAEVAQHRRIELREVGLSVRHHVVEGRHRAHLRVHGRRPHRKATAEAEADGP